MKSLDYKGCLFFSQFKYTLSLVDAIKELPVDLPVASTNEQLVKGKTIVFCPLHCIFGSLSIQADGEDGEGTPNVCFN